MYYKMNICSINVLNKRAGTRLIYCVIINLLNYLLVVNLFHMDELFLILQRPIPLWNVFICFIGGALTVFFATHNIKIQITRNEKH